MKFRSICLILVIVNSLFGVFTVMKNYDDYSYSNNAMKGVTNVGKKGKFRSSTISNSRNGTPQQRRKLAALGSSSISDAMWRKMASAYIEREKNLDGIFALHVSKSGGTSLCDAMKFESCFANGKKANCWHNKYRTDNIDLGPQWVRKKREDEINFKLGHWVYYDENKTPSSRCSDTRAYLYKHNHTLAMSENWLPSGGVCKNDFLNVMIFRHPLERLLSHYRHLYADCIHHSTSTLCSQMLTTDGHFDIDFMNKTFDIITDNYYTRSLNEQTVYKEPTGFNGNGLQFLKSAMKNLRSFDWILLLGPEGGEGLNQTNLIMEQGIGLSDGLPHSRKRSGKKKKTVWSVNDEIRLRNMNVFDLKLWDEAKKLHELDVKSIHKMKLASTDLWDQRLAGRCNQKAARCCGTIRLG